MYNSKHVFVAACIGILLFGVGLITLGSVATGLKMKFQLDDIAAGTLFSVLPVGILCGSLLFGPFCDRYGYKVFLMISALCMFAGFQGIAHLSSFGLLNIAIFLFGLGGGALNGATNAVVSDISTENKAANLSLLGVFFAIGALGMPVVLGALEDRFAFDQILSAVGFLALLATISFSLIRFPPPKQAQGIPFAKGLGLLKDKILLLIAFFLFCQSSYEGIINNWTTTYLTTELAIAQSNALYALSLYIAGMAVMRLLIGSVLRPVSPASIMYISFGLLLAGNILLRVGDIFPMAVAGLVLIGAGLAAGFPVMLGFVGNRYAQLSGTAFSIVMVIALVGNMLINFLMGIIAENYGIFHLSTVAFIELAVMVVLTLVIVKNLNQYQS